MEWILTNKKNYLPSDGNFISYTGGNYTFYVSDEDYDINIFNEETVVLVDGYLLPRINSNISFNKQNPSITIKDLYRKAGKDYINDVKGYFISIIMGKNKFIIDSDHFGVKKFFIHDNDNTFIISNNIKNIVREIQPDISQYSIVDHIMFNRYIDGNTIYTGISFNRPGHRIVYDGALRHNYYWDYNILLNSIEDKITINNHVEDYKRIIKGYIDHFSYDSVSVPLTGGVDCRTIIAALLSLGIRPSTYTYGDPESNDSIYGEYAARTLGLQFSVHYLEPDYDTFNKLIKEIWDQGNTLVSLHRAHRLYGIKREADGKKPLMFLGYMGGEWIRGLWPDDLIISRPLRRAWAGNEPYTKIVEDEFKKNYFLFNNDDIDYGAQKLKEFSSEDINQRFMKYLVEGMAHLHYAQDLNIIDRYVIPVPVYIDIDYLRSLFLTDYTFRNTVNMTKNKFNKLRSPEYNALMLEKLYKPVARIPLGKGYTPSIYRKNKYLAFAQKFYSDQFKTNKYKPNYSYEGWYNDFLSRFFNNVLIENNYFQFPVNILSSVSIKKETDALPYSRILDLHHSISLAENN